MRQAGRKLLSNREAIADPIQKKMAARKKRFLFAIS
jgi:hypothetical protein